MCYKEMRLGDKIKKSNTDGMRKNLDRVTVAGSKK